MEEGWEDGLDVDDSDLPSLHRPLPSLPPLRPCSQLSRPSQPLPPHPPLRPREPPSPSPAEQEGEEAAPPPPRRIPGPAGAVQAAMNRQAAVAMCRGDPPPEGGGDGRGELGDGEEEFDEDFVRNPWLCALDFLGGNGIPSLSYPINSIKALGNTDRIPKLVGIVKSCRPNGLGDLFVTLKDPTGTIGASIHRRVLMEGNFGGDFSVGCVLILKQVAIFSPMRSTCYVNVTLNNVVKLFGKDSDPPSRHISPILTTKCPVSGKNLDNQTESAVRACLFSQGSERTTVQSQRGPLVASGTAGRVNKGVQRSVQIFDRELVDSVPGERTVGDRPAPCLSGTSTSSGESANMPDAFRCAPRSSLVRQGVDNFLNEEIIRNSNSKRRMDDGAIEYPCGKLQDSVNATATTTFLGRSMPGSPFRTLGHGAHHIVNEQVKSINAMDHGKGEGSTARLNMNVTSTTTSLGRRILCSPSRQGSDHIVNDQVRSSSNTAIDCGKKEGPMGSLPCNASCTSVINSVISKSPGRVVGPKSVISKVSVAQWTDEQLSELFCDYQDDADFF